MQANTVFIWPSANPVPVFPVLLTYFDTVELASGHPRRLERRPFPVSCGTVTRISCPPHFVMKHDAEMMADIVTRVGDPQARQMVLNAYNTEILSNRLGRLEHAQTGAHLPKAAMNIMRLALVRVHEVVMLGE